MFHFHFDICRMKSCRFDITAQTLLLQDVTGRFQILVQLEQGVELPKRKIVAAIFL